jgi:hypothetical protein
MKLIISVALLLLVSGCTIDREAAEREERRIANLTPKQRCMEAVDGDKAQCDLQCVLGNWGAPQNQQNCKNQCLQQKSTGYQLCSYK